MDLNELMNQKIHVTLTDGRTVRGALHCIDFQCNMILHDVQIEHEHSATAQLLTSAMVNGKTITRIEIDSK